MYQDKENRIIVVDKGPYGNWTFYRKNKLNQRGQRLKPRTIPKFYPSKPEAEIALKKYAEKQGWKPYRVTLF